MKCLILYAHPNPKSFNRALRDTIREALAAAQSEVRVRDLYAMGYKPVLDAEDFAALQAGDVPPDIAQAQDDLKWAECVFLVFPVWWYGTPAILKGWLDRTLQHGFAFSFASGAHEGLLEHLKVVVVATAGGSEEDMGDGGNAFLQPLLEGTFGFCGVTDVAGRVFWSVPSSTDEERQAMLEETREYVTELARGN